MKPKFKCILFDLDGTLVDSSLDIANATNYTLTRLGYDPLEVSKIMEYVGSGVRQLIEGAIGASAHDHEDLSKQAFDYFTQYYVEHIADYSKWYPNVMEVLNELSRRHKIGILTNKPMIFTRPLLNILDVHKKFTHIATCGDSYPKKPDPEGALALMNQLNVLPDETLFVGDSYIDVQTARASGMKMAFVRYGFGHESELENLKHVDYFLDDFKSLLQIIEA